MKKKLIRTATVAMSLDILLKGQLAFLNQYFEVIAVSGQDNHLENVAGRENVQTIDVAFQRHISPIQDLISLFKLYKILKKEKPFMIHSITPKAGLLSMIAGYFAGVPIRIHTFTGLIFPSKTGFIRVLLMNLDKLLCVFATHIIPEGNGVKNDLFTYKITNKPLKVIANGNVNGIDLECFNPDLFSDQEKIALKENLQISEIDFVFIYVGRLVADKGINELVSAFDKLSNKNKNVKLLLVGNFENELDPLLPKTIETLKRNKSIFLVGFKVDVRPYFAIANVLVFPSYREGFPNVVLQAAAMNLPSIVSDINGCNEIIQNNFNGIIIKPKSYLEIYDAMSLLINDNHLLKYLSLNARKVIIDKFDQSIVWSSLLNYYNKAR